MPGYDGSYGYGAPDLCANAIPGNDGKIAFAVAGDGKHFTKGQDS